MQTRKLSPRGNTFDGFYSPQCLPLNYFVETHGNIKSSRPGLRLLLNNCVTWCSAQVCELVDWEGL